MPKLKSGKETVKFLSIRDPGPICLLSHYSERHCAFGDACRSRVRPVRLVLPVRPSQAQSSLVQPNPTIPSPPGKEIGKETGMFLANFDHRPSCYKRKHQARFTHQSTAMGPLTPAAGTDTFPPGLSILTAAVIVQILANFELSRLRIALTSAGTLSRSASAEFGTGIFFIASAICVIRPITSLLQLASIFFTSAPQSTHIISSTL